MRLAETDYTFTEGGTNHEIEVVATATLTEMPAPSLDIDGGSILKFSITLQRETAAPTVDYVHFSNNRFIDTEEECEVETVAGDDVQVCRTKVPVTVIDDTAAEKDETFEVVLARTSGSSARIHAQGSDGVISDGTAEYTVKIIDNDFGATGVAVTSTPLLTASGSTSADTYGVGETIEFSVSFTRPVTVTGTPTFSFDLAGTTKTASYQEGSGTGELVFAYLVVPGDTDRDGIAWAADALALAGGTIVETGGTEVAVLTVDDQAMLSEHKVDESRVAPGIEIAPTGADNTVRIGSDTAYAFEAEDFGFADTNPADTLASVRIESLPSAGELELNGTAVSLNSVVTGTQIDGDMFTFTPAPGAIGDAYASFMFKVNDGTDFSADANTMTINVIDLSCGMPGFGGRRGHWSAEVTVGGYEDRGNVLYYGFDEGFTIGGLAPKVFSIGSNSYTINSVFVETDVNNEGVLLLSLTSSNLTSAEAAALKLHVCDSAGFDFAGPEVTHTDSNHVYGWAAAALDWSPPVATRTLYLSLPANNPATGEPTITGTAQAGQVLTADASPIGDDDGLPSVFDYQWSRVDADGTSNETEITGETAAIYTLATADVGKKIKVKVSFTDDLSSVEERTSAATATVTADTTPVSGGLVSNLNQVASDNKLYFGSGSTNYSFAQGFTTGANPGGYTLTSIEVAFSAGVSAAAIGNVTASVWTADGSGNPATDLFTLNKPASFDRPTTTTSGGNNEFHTLSGNYSVFTAPANTTLNASTQYLVVVSGGLNHLYSTASDAETGAAGWLIANAARRKQTTAGSWAAQSAGHAMSIRVNGTTGGGTTNTAPTAADNTVTTGVGAAYTFTADDFGFDDADTGDALASVKIVTLPSPGTLALDGAAVSVNDVVTKAQIDGNMLTFTPVAGASGAPYASFTFKVNDGMADSDSATMTIDVAVFPAITIEADREKATGLVDWVEYTLTRGGDPAQALTVTVMFEGPAGNDWNLEGSSRSSQAITFNAGDATAQTKLLMGAGFFGIGFAADSSTSGTLTAGLGATVGYDTNDTETVDIVLNAGPAWVVSLAETDYTFTEGGTNQEIEVVATAISTEMPAPSLDNGGNSVLQMTILTRSGTAISGVDFDSISDVHYIDIGGCGVETVAGNDVQVCRTKVPLTVIDDTAAEKNETFELDLSRSVLSLTRIHFKGSDGVISEGPAEYTVTIIDDDFGATGVAVTSTPLLMASGSTSADTYGAGETIEFSVSFTRPVTVIGTPTFSFDLDGTTKTASYQEGTGTGELVFAYRVVPGDTDSDGIAWAADALALAGGTIVETGGTAAAALTVDDQAMLSEHKVDGSRMAPGANNAPTAADNTVTIGSDTVYTFEAEDFGFADTDVGATLASVRIESVPGAGERRSTARRCR